VSEGPLTAGEPRVGVICVLYGNRDLPPLVDQVARAPNVATIVVDNSGDLDAVTDERISILRPSRNIGYPAAVNRAAAALPNDRDVVLLVNPDVEGDAATVLQMAGAVAVKAGAVLAAPRSADGRFGMQAHPTITSTLVTYGLRRHAQRRPGVDGYLSGAILLLNRMALAGLTANRSLLDEQLFFMDDVELTDRARVAGIAVEEIPIAGLLSHLGGETMRRRPAVRVYFGRVSVVRYWRRRSRAKGAILRGFFVAESIIGMALTFRRRAVEGDPEASVFEGLRKTAAWLLTQRPDIDDEVLGDVRAGRSG
jgi:GT2 family glycosyltransferase